jgi:hypothetical protein
MTPMAMPSICWEQIKQAKAGLEKGSKSKMMKAEDGGRRGARYRK